MIEDATVLQVRKIPSGPYVLAYRRPGRRREILRHYWLHPAGRHRLVSGGVGVSGVAYTLLRIVLGPRRALHLYQPFLIQHLHDGTAAELDTTAGEIRAWARNPAHNATAARGG